jgi:hypothetical protein
MHRMMAGIATGRFTALAMTAVVGCASTSGLEQRVAQLEAARRGDVAGLLETLDRRDRRPRAGRDEIGGCPKRLAVDEQRLRVGELGVALDEVPAVRVDKVAVLLLPELLDERVLLGDELRETALAKTRRTAIDAEPKDRNVSLAELEQAVIAGTLTLDQFVAELVLSGLAPEDAELLGSLLLDALEASPA